MYLHYAPGQLQLLIRQLIDVQRNVARIGIIQANTYHYNFGIAYRDRILPNHVFVEYVPSGDDENGRHYETKQSIYPFRYLS